MKNWMIISLVALMGARTAMAGPAGSPPQIVVSSESPALLVEDVQIGPHDGKIRGAVVLRFGYGAPLLPHVHVYGMNASGRVIAEACDKLNGTLRSNPRPVGKGRAFFAADLGDLAGVATIQVVTHAGQNDCRMEDNRIVRLF